MIYLSSNENYNKYDENEVESDKTFDKFKSLLSENLSKKEQYIRKFKDSIKLMLPIKETQSKLNELFPTFAELVKYFGITFCELIKKDEELLNILFNLLLKENMTKIIEEILFNIVRIYNYSSNERNFGDIIKVRLSQCFHNFPFQDSDLLKILSKCLLIK